MSEEQRDRNTERKRARERERKLEIEKSTKFAKLQHFEHTTALRKSAALSVSFAYIDVIHLKNFINKQTLQLNVNRQTYRASLCFLIIRAAFHFDYHYIFYRISFWVLLFTIHMNLTF